VLVILVGNGGVIGAGLGALRLNLNDIIAQGESLAVDVMSALLHGVVEAGASGAVVTASDDTVFLEPLPGGADLATVAAHGLALEEIAAGGGVRDGEESCEVSAGGDADTIVDGLGGAMGPAGATVGLIANVVDDGVALGPLDTRVKGGGDSVVYEHGGVTGALGDGPVGVDDGAHEVLDLLEGGTGELGVVASNPVGPGVSVDGLNVGSQIEGHLLTEEVKDVAILTELDVLASGLGVSHVDELSLVSEEVDALLKLGELLVDLIELDVAALGGEIDNVLAKFADVVVLSEEVVDLGGVGSNGESGEGERAHSC